MAEVVRTRDSGTKGFLINGAIGLNPFLDTI